ncbi:MAG: hypothetical protein ACXV7H_00615 [Methylobacter sp.]
MTTAVEKWLTDNPETSSDYFELVERLRIGDKVECLIEINGKSMIALAERIKTGWGEVFNIDRDDALFTHSTAPSFIEFCEESNVIFAKQSFLERTRKMLEIAKNAAQFKGISVQLNTPQEVEVLLALMDRDSALSSVR